MVLAYLSAMSYLLYEIQSTETNLFPAWSQSWRAHTFLYILCNCVVILATYAFTYDRLIVLQSLSKVSRVLSRRDFDDMAKFLHTKDIVVMLYHCFVLLYFVADSRLWTPRYFIVMAMPCVTIQGEMFYANCVHILGGCFKKVDEMLRRLNEPPPERSELLRTFRSLLNEQDASMLTRLKRCEKLHEEISDVVESLNKSYRGILTVIMVFEFYTITFNLYYFIEGFESIDELDLESAAYRLLPFSSIVYGLTKFSTTIWLCETTTNHANQIATTINIVHADCTDTAVRQELRCFALQVAHRDIRFSAKTFVMNAKLLSQLLGQIVIYVMILFQFMFDTNCDDKRLS
ncbi:uncharacterized protein LOC117222529 [Megalopta genalis]|uniref:uncharacterized protein LOC117222529 n=1 Tax=Megalopta genalis TaxID=115081 RepID=UPI003FCEF28B